MTASVLHFPTRPAPTLAVNNAPAREAFQATPRGRFEAHVGHLISLGHINAGRLVLYAYRRFSALDAIPHPDDFGLCMKLLAEVDPSDALASQHVRHAMTALVEIARPFPETSPECA